MRASILSWPKASGLLVCAAATISPLSAFAAGDGSGSVTFVDRAALAANGWSGSSANPLRAPSDAAPSQYGANTLRNAAPPSDDTAGGDDISRPAEEVVPASYSSRDQNGLQLRPYSQPTGIFDSAPAAAPQSAYQPKPKPKAPNKQTATQPAAQSAAQAGPQSARSAPTYQGYQSSQAPPAAAERSQGLVPQFLSFAPKTKPKTIPPSYGTSAYGTSASGATAAGPAGLAAALAPTARAGSAAQQNSPYGTVSRSQDRSATPNPAGASQAGYATAAAAESYSRPGTPASGPTAARRAPQAAAAPAAAAAYANPNARAATPRQPAVAASYRPTPAPQTQAETNNSPAAQMLVQAHTIADRASTEEDFSQVCSACQRVMASQPNPTEATFAKQLAAWSLNRRGQLKASAGRSEDALDDFTSAIQLDPQLWRAIHNRGVLMAQSGQFDKAFDDFNRTTELNPQFAKAFSNRAALYVVAGQLEPALHDYERACELDATLEVAQRGCGRTCHMLGRLDEADKHLNRALELNPNDAAAFTSRGDLLTDVGNYANAAADYDRAIQLDGKSAEACRGSAWLLATCPDSNIRNPDVAIHRAELAMKLEHKPDPTTYDTLAAAQASAGDFAAATQTIRHAIELAPPSEKSVYQDRLSMYRQSTPFQISPLPGVRQAEYSAVMNR
jgi:tetratricopeptide (TPR) repeat protein